MNRKPNHIDDPEQYAPTRCVACLDAVTCWLHKLGRICIHGGPYAGYADKEGKLVVEVAHG